MKLSIITINYNNCEGLRKTIKSVVSQTFRDFEYVIIDGGSTDGSVDVIKEYADRVDYWVSEKDHGIYHAMNKGAFAAHGEYTQFLNSGDYLCDERVLEKVFANQFNEDIVCGNMYTSRGDERISPDEVSMAYMLTGTLLHPVSFIKRALFDVYKYDERYKIMGDRDFFMYHLIKENVSYRKVNVFVAVFDVSGISCTSTNKDADRALINHLTDCLIPPRVRADYRNFMGEDDYYHSLFYTLSFAKLRKYVYTLVVLFVKIITFNRGWIKDYPIRLRKQKI